MGHECHWLRGTYDAKTDEWRWKVLVSDNSNSRYKSGGINFVDGRVYWISDANGGPPYDRGVFRCARHIADPRRHLAVQPPGRICEHDHPGRSDPGVALRTRIAHGHGIIVSLDLGQTWRNTILRSSADDRPSAFTRRTATVGLGST